jgi:hypothetical protein
MHTSTGILRYSVEERVGHKLIVEIDPGIAETYRALVPKYVRLQRPRFAPHISVIRKERIPEDKLHLWGAHDGKPVEFSYDPTIYNDELYYWLRVYSAALKAVRKELGLDELSELARPPDLHDCFHTTIGNTKGTP